MGGFPNAVPLEQAAMQRLQERGQAAQVDAMETSVKVERARLDAALTKEQAVRMDVARLFVGHPTYNLAHADIDNAQAWAQWILDGNVPTSNDTKGTNP